MKICMKCFLFHQEGTLWCSTCHGELKEISFERALEVTRKRAFRKQMQNKKKDIPDAYKQHYIRQYLGDQSLFLLFDLYKNRLKHGKKLKRFLIQPINFTAFLNIPWFFFNIISSNIFHLQYTRFCERCQCKRPQAQHAQEECDYNIEYFNILNDILTGDIVNTKRIYIQKYLIDKFKHRKSAYADLFLRDKSVEVFFDIFSIFVSICFWIYIAVYISYPMLLVLLQKMEFYDAYEWIFF